MAASHSILILLIAFSIRFSHADRRLDIVARSCELFDVPNVTRYTTNYAVALDNMRYEVYRNKFAFSEVGRRPDRLHVLSQCLDDLSNKECAECFQKVSHLLQSCFPATGGRVYLDGCFIRASNYSFYSEIIALDDTKRCGDDTDEEEERFGKLLRSVLEKIKKKTPEKGGFAIVHECKNGTTIHGMGQCWRTLDHDTCSACLDTAVKSVFQCMPSDEGRALRAGCFLRYSTCEFAYDPDADENRYNLVSFISYILCAVIIGALAVAVGLCLGKMTFRRMNFTRRREGEEFDMSTMIRAMQFKLSTLEKATDNFSEAHKLGSGGYGEVYKGTLQDGREIAVKRLFINGKSRSEEIYNEMDVISKAQHKTLVRFLGGCFTTLENFLVYEYLPSNSVDSILFDPEKKKELDWEKGSKIILGAAEGLEYLDKGCGVRISHREIKGSNILLDLKYRPKIADFGLARFSSWEGDKNSPANNAVAGAFGYMAPEYIAKGRLTEKVDVYSFGVLMLEIVSGVKNTTLESDNCLETLVWKHFQTNTTSRIIDNTLNIEDAEEIKRVIHLGLLCTQEKPALRPTMTKLIQVLRNKDMKMPVPTKPPFLDVESSASLGFNPSRSKMYSSSLHRYLQDGNHQWHCN